MRSTCDEMFLNIKKIDVVLANLQTDAGWKFRPHAWVQHGHAAAGNAPPREGEAQD